MRPSPCTPTLRTSAKRTTGHCQISRSRPAAFNSKRAIASASRNKSRRSCVTSPTMRIPRPGPGNGWRQTISSGSPNSNPTCRTSSLNRVLSGSTKVNFKSSGNPPTLWWDLMLAVPLPPPDSTTSGYNVPCTKNSTSPPAAILRAAASNDRMNSRPIIFRFSSGSVTPLSASKNCFFASTTTN